MRRWFALVAVSSALGTACQEEARGPSGDNDGTSRQATEFFTLSKSFQLSPEPLLVVGLGEALPLSRVRAAFFIRDRIVIANSGSDEILFLDGEAQLTRRQGRGGAAPGEYRSLLDLSRYRDGLVAWDPQLSRLSILDADGGYLSSTTVQLRAGSGLWRLVGAVGSSLLFHWSEHGFPGEGAVGPLEARLEDEFVIVRASDGSIVREIALPGQERWVELSALRARTFGVPHAAGVGGVRPSLR